MYIGKTKINIDASRFYRCGTPWSSDWQVSKYVPYRIGNFEGYLRIYVCNECKNKECQQELV